jgi:hypothetical protein
LCEDIKVLGKREMSILLNYRYKYIHNLAKQRKQDKDTANNALPKAEPTEEDLEAQNEKELEDTIKRVEKDRKKQEKKERERKVKGDLRQKMSVIASSDIHNQTDDVLFDRRTFERLQEVDIEDLDYENDSEDDDENDEAILKDSLGEGRKFNSNDRYVHQMKMENGSEGSDDSEGDSEDEAVKRVEAMANDIDTFYSQKKDYKMELNRKVAKREKRQKALVEQQRLKRIDAEEEEELNNDDIREKKKGVKFGADTKADASSDSDL